MFCGRSKGRRQGVFMPQDSLHPSDLFDLEILLPVHPTGKWLDRLESFRRFGLLPAPSLRVRLVLLCGTYDLDPELRDASVWPGVDSVAVVNSTSDHPAPKIYDYYANVLPEEGLRARWFLRVDDDSLTDIRRLMNHLDFTFGWRDPLHLTGTIGCNAFPPYLSALRELSGERFLQGAEHCLLFHEREHALTSYGAMRRIIANRMAREFLRRIALIPNGLRDHGLSYAARICGIPLSQMPFLSAQCQLNEFALFSPTGNGFFHIHGLSPDNAGMWSRYMGKRFALGLSTDEADGKAALLGGSSSQVRSGQQSRSVYVSR